MLRGGPTNSLDRLTAVNKDGTFLSSFPYSFWISVVLKLAVSSKEGQETACLQQQTKVFEDSRLAQTLFRPSATCCESIIARGSAWFMPQVI